MSPLSARKAEELGYTNVKVFTTGLPSWKKAKGLVVTEPEHLMGLIQKDAAHVVVDLRPANDARQGHIRGAVSIPAEEIASAKGMFPMQKSAPIVLYSRDGVDERAFGSVRAWGYKNVSVLAGGASGWLAAGGRLFADEPATTITYEPRPLPGTVPAAEFKAMAGGRRPDKLILDVRDGDEAMQGIIGGAMNIPVAELEARVGELPKDAEILVHCSTGIRAQMAQGMLARAGYRARYLDSVIQVAPDGSFEIDE